MQIGKREKEVRKEVKRWPRERRQGYGKGRRKGLRARSIMNGRLLVERKGRCGDQLRREIYVLCTCRV